MTRWRSAAIVALTSLVLAGSAHADVYSFTDADGVVHLTNVRPRGANAGRYRVIMRTPPQRAARPGVVPVMPSDSDPARYSRYDAVIAEAARLYAIPTALIRAVIRVESDYDPRVVSSCGAQGLMQLMPTTGRRMSVRDPFDPRQNVLGGSRYLRYLANMFGGDLVLTIAGYHAGEAAVVRYRGIPPYDTTQAYVRNVLRNFYRYRERESASVGSGAGRPTLAGTAP